MKRQQPRGLTRIPHAKETFELEVERLTWGGRALGRHGGKVVFVPKGVPGDRLQVEVTRDKKSFSEARLLEVLSPGAGRVDPGCPWFSRCGGCQWLAAHYATQVSQKEALLRSALRHHLEGLELEPLSPADPTHRYRHRGDFHVQPSGDGARLGFFEEGSHRLVEVSGCLLFEPGFDEGLTRVRKVLEHEPTARALERLTLAHSEGDSGALVVHGRLRRGAGEHEAASLAERLMGAGLRGAVLSGAMLDPALAEAGDRFISFGVPGPGGDMMLRADVRSFTQAHFAMNRELVRAASAWLTPSSAERVLDLYSGVGNFSLPLATACAEVVAVEGSSTACADALANACANGIANIRHVEGAVAPALERLASEGERFEAVLLDPPRTGAREALDALARLEPSRILYIACNLSALERDLGVLTGLGYRPIRVRGFDCFPQTYALETLCLLERA
jgi:23S rRNA (uracil1939-C5)-methyltransferase